MLSEKVVLPAGMLEVFFEDQSCYLLRYRDLVEYRPGEKRVRGRRQPYAFRSVEQMRYDFERDVEAA